MEQPAWIAIGSLILTLLVGGIVLRRPRYGRRRRDGKDTVALVYPVPEGYVAPPPGSAPARAARWASPAAQPAGEWDPWGGAVGASPGEDGEFVEGRSIRYHRPDQLTMRLLPGRLEVVDGEEGRMEVRFLDLPGEPQQITFGRSEGPPFRHVQLTSSTVSRVHATMTWNGLGWLLSNRSRTNPVVVNGIQLGEPEASHPLSDGDRIEMGEVVFRYRSS